MDRLGRLGKAGEAALDNATLGAATFGWALIVWQGLASLILEDHGALT